MTETSQTFVNSIKSQSIPQLSGGETIGLFRHRIQETLRLVIQNGLCVKNGKVVMDQSVRTEQAKAAIKKLSSNDRDFLNNGGDAFFNMAGRFINLFECAMMPPEKMQSQPGWEKRHKGYMGQMVGIIIDARQKGMIDGSVVPRNWQDRVVEKSQIGESPSGVSAQLSMAMHRTL